jgi:hypothetical protein
MNTRRCTHCKEEKTFDQFYASKSGKYGIMSWCRECHKQKTGRKQRDQRYQISKEMYEAMYKAQGGVCAICGKEETVVVRGKLKNLGVDHDHSCCMTQKRCGECNRGLLCSHCNVGLGNLGDDPARLRAALAYLESWA